MNINSLILRISKVGQAIKSYRCLFALIYYRVLVGSEHRPVLKKNDFALVVDIGANRGQFALAVRQYSPNAKVISFEPLPEPASIYSEIFSKDEKVALHEFAIGPESGASKIHISARDDSSSLLPISKLQNETFPGTAKIGTQKIQIARLMEFISPDKIQSPALLKIDVQGYELETLKGCEDLLDCFQYIYVECSFMELYEGQSFAQDVIVYLDKYGFVLNGIYNMSYDKKGNAVQADFFFTHNSSIEE